VSSAAAPAAIRYQQTFHGRADQVAQVRRDLAAHLAGSPVADDAVLIASDSLNLRICLSCLFWLFSGLGLPGFRGRLRGWCGG
jgi:hypothetical protein